MPDPHRTTDEDYLEWVRQQKCAVCLSAPPNDPHHLTSKGAGGSDRTAIPLCRDCHRRYHDLGHDAFQSHRSVDLWKQAHRHLRRYLEQTETSYA
jgi:transposase-like protein